MRRMSILTLGVGSVLLLGLGGSPASAASAAASAQDTTFVTGNAQVDLTEIGAGKIALARATSDQAKALATKTMADHETALAKLEVVAGKLGITLPTAPNAEQQADAATLQSVASADFDLTYAKIQIAGHEKSIAATNAELSGGSDPDVLAFATGYLPVAQMHLDMSNSLLSALGGGTPGSVPAGSGGLAATTSSTTTAWQIALVLLGALLLLAAGLAYRRRIRIQP